MGKRIGVVFAGLMLSIGTGHAQAPAIDAAKVLVSPEVHPDRSITFRYRAPNAREVALTGKLAGGTNHQILITKGNDGVWTGSTGNLWLPV